MTENSTKHKHFPPFLPLPGNILHSKHTSDLGVFNYASPNSIRCLCRSLRSWLFKNPLPPCGCSVSSMCRKHPGYLQLCSLAAVTFKCFHSNGRVSPASTMASTQPPAVWQVLTKLPKRHRMKLKTQKRFVDSEYDLCNILQSNNTSECLIVHFSSLGPLLKEGREGTYNFQIISCQCGCLLNLFKLCRSDSWFQWNLP